MNKNNSTFVKCMNLALMKRIMPDRKNKMKLRKWKGLKMILLVNYNKVKRFKNKHSLS